MSLTVKNWSLKSLWHLYNDDELDLRPDYQRREAWSDKKSMILIDSLARRIPINAITLYKSSASGAVIYEVIDGKQRLTALFNFMEGKLKTVSDALNDLSDEEVEEGKELAAKIMDKSWGELDAPTKSAFQDYEVPVYIVEGSRASAVRAFRRMNSDPYALNSQEIRNAVFRDSAFLAAVRTLSDNLRNYSQSTDHFLVEWGLMTSSQWDRMKDLQFLSELLCLKLKGPQEARRSLDDFYEEFSRPAGKKGKLLKEAAKLAEESIVALHSILGQSLKEHSLDNENDFYCLVGALFKRGIPTKSQLNNKILMQDLRDTISKFRLQVLLCQNAITKNDTEKEVQYNGEVRDYMNTLLSGQTNSARRREIRINIWVSVIDDRLAPVDPNKPSDLQRRLVWAGSSDKKCGRCAKVVAWKDYDCGHVDARALGGRAVLSNLRVEHASCNRSAGATRD